MKRSLKILGCFIITCALGIYYSTISNAAIEIKPGTTTHTNITATVSYQYCYDMRSSTSTLGVNSLDPHLTLNADWGAVAYLGASTYGNVRSIKGTSVTIDEKTYYSTTNNITGVINMGNNYTQTSSITLDGTVGDNLKNIGDNQNTKYVELLPTTASIENTKGLAIKETAGWYSSQNGYPGGIYPLGIRTLVLGFYSGTDYTGHTIPTGYGGGNVTYRPVIWN